MRDTWDLIIAMFSFLGVLIGATWFLSTKIGEIATSIAAHAAQDGATQVRVRSDLDRHEKRLDSHDERLTAVEQGRLMVAVLRAMKQVDPTGGE